MGERGATPEDELNRFWNQVVREMDGRTDPVASGGTLDPGLAQAIRRLHALAGPSPVASRQRVARRLGAGGETMPSRGGPATGAATNATARPIWLRPTDVVGGREAPEARARWRPVAVRGVGWVGTRAATVLLLVLTFGVARMAFDGGGGWRGGAPATPATPAPPLAAVEAETLMRVGLPAGALGRTEGTWHALREYSIAPGAALRYRRPCDAPTLIVGYVEAGTYAVRAVGPLEVIRGGDGAVPGARIAVEAGTEVVLERGDGLVYRVAPGEDRSGFRNPGPGGLLVLEWVWWGEAACPLGRVEDAPPENMRPRWDNFGASPPLDPTQALTLRFRRIAAGPGAVLPEAGPEGAGVLPGHAAGMELLVVAEGRVASSVRKGPGEAASSEVVFVPHHGVAGTEDLPAGMSRVLRNAGDGPLVLVALTITPDEGAGTPAAG